MEMLDSVKNLYEKSDEMIVVTDKNLAVIWKSNDSLPDFISVSDFMPEFGKAPALPVDSSKILHHLSGNSVKIKPLFNNDELEGYMMTFFDADEIETLSDRSAILKYKRNSLGNIRLAISPIIAQLDSLKNKNGSDDLGQLYDSISCSLLKMLSSTVNTNEISKYYSGEFSSELLNVSQCLDETALLCRDGFESAGCEFSTDIEPALFMNMNYERLSLAIMNLLINGYMYCDAEHKQLVLKAYKKDEEIFIEVYDNGKSADTDTMRAAMQPFRTLAKFKTGEMLGLAIVNKLAEHFSGKTDFIKSSDGLTVRLTFSAKISERPQSFRLKRKPPIVGDYEPAYCILAKGLKSDK